MQQLLCAFERKPRSEEGVAAASMPCLSSWFLFKRVLVCFPVRVWYPPKSGVYLLLQGRSQSCWVCALDGIVAVHLKWVSCISIKRTHLVYSLPRQ